jgi:hypothetical protein
MSIQDSKTVDFVSLASEPNTALLVVSDHFDWTNTLDHQFALQEKLNAYLSFIESHELYARFPKAKGKRVEIRVMFQHEPDPSGINFLRNVRHAIEQAGFHFSYQVGITSAPKDRVN